MKKHRGSFFLALLVLLLCANFVTVQEKRQKEPPVPKIVYADVEQPDPVIQALVDQLKYYRKIGDAEKANEIWKKLTPFIKYEPERLETEEKDNFGAVVDWVSGYEIPKSFSVKWLGNDYYVMCDTNHNKAPSMEILSGHGTYNPNVYIAGEEWWVFKNPNQIMLRRSDTHGSSWPMDSPYSQMITSVFELSAPKIRQIHPDYLAVVFERQYTPSDYDIHWAKVKWDFSSSSYLIIDDSSGTNHRYPDITSDFEDFGAGAYIYVVYWQGGTLLFTLSIDGGSTWSSPVTLANSFDAPQCSIDYEDGNLYVAARNYQGINVKRSTDFGISWSSWTNIGGAYYPSIAANGDIVEVVYEYPYSSMDICYAFSVNGGLSWNIHNDLASSTVDETRPVLRSYKGVDPYIYCAHNQEPSFVTIWRTTTTEPWSWSYVGSVKDTPTDVSMDMIPGLVPKLTPSGGIEGVAVCWEEYYDDINGYDIAFDGYWLPCVPAVFSYVEPADNVSNVSLNVDLDWDDSVGADSFDVYFGNLSPPPFVTNVSSSFYDPGTLNPNETYHWQIKAKNVCGETPGPVWSFMTIKSWEMLSSDNPEHMIELDLDGNGDDEVVADFGSAGLALWNDGFWSSLSAYNPENMIAANTDGGSTEELVVDFGGVGMWLLESGIWTQIGGDAENMIAADTDGDNMDEVIADFVSSGLKLWDSSIWSVLTYDNPENVMSADMNGDGDDELIADFGSIGIWQWNGTWIWMTGDNPEFMIAADVDGNGDDELIADFGSVGVWRWDGSWSWMTGDNPEYMIAADVDGNGDDELIADFGSVGLWRWDGSWSWMTGDNPEFMIAADVDGDGDDELTVDFGSVGVWQWDGSWSWMTGDNPEYMIAADVDGDGAVEVVVDFGALGTWMR